MSEIAFAELETQVDALSLIQIMLLKKKIDQKIIEIRQRERQKRNIQANREQLKKNVGCVPAKISPLVQELSGIIPAEDKDWKDYRGEYVEYLERKYE